MKLTYKGRIFTSVREISEFTGIANSSVYRRVENYQKKQITLDEVFKRNTKFKVAYNGKVYKSQPELSKVLGISQTELSRRWQLYKQNKISLADITKPVGSPINIFIDGTMYKNRQALVNDMHTSKSIVNTIIASYQSGKITRKIAEQRLLRKKLLYKIDPECKNYKEIYTKYGISHTSMTKLISQYINHEKPASQIVKAVHDWTKNH